MSEVYYPSAVVVVHSLLRWGIVALFVVLFVFCVFSYNHAKKHEALDSSQGGQAIRRLSAVLSGLVDLSALLGIFLYVQYMRMHSDAILSSPVVRKRLLEHGPAMLAVVVLVHVAGVIVKRKTISDQKRFFRMALLYLICLLLILGTTPSWRLPSL